STCSYVDWLHADLIVLFGSNAANNQPVTTKYFHYAKQNGARVAVVNPYREPGLERYWIPSIASSALFGTPLADDWFDVHTGGDLAFLVGVLRALIETNGVDEAFVRERTVGFEAARDRALAAGARLDGVGDDRSLGGGRGRSLLDRRRQFPRDDARRRSIVPRAGTTAPSHPPRHRRVVVDAPRRRGRRRAAAGGDAL